MKKYFKQYKEAGAKPEEVTKEEARRTLERWWQDEALNDIFENDRGFRLYTPFSEVWTMDDDGTVPEAGYYGIVG